MERYKVVPSRCWQHKDGRTVSIFGAAPWTRQSDRNNWTLVQRGWTVENTQLGTTGIGRKPWATQAEAQAWANAHNAQS